MQTLDDLLGYFRRESAAQPEAFSGERLTSAVGGQVQVEHYHRYLFARSLCAGRDVVDVASGEGYGAAQLSQVARRVVGVEFASPTVALARANFARPNLHFVRADARSLPIADASTDVVTSFETIEHFPGAEAFVAEVRRILRPDGCFIVSTPERETYAHAGIVTNPFHVREFTRREFEALLSRHFGHVTILLQRALVGSALAGEGDAPGPPIVFERRDRDRFEATLGIPRAPYIVAIAANRPVPPVPNSLYIERGDLDTDAHVAAERAREIERLRADLMHCRQTMAQEADTRARERQEVERVERDLSAALRGAEARLAVVEQELAASAQALDRLGGSTRTFLKTYLPRLYRHLRGR